MREGMTAYWGKIRMSPAYAAGGKKVPAPAGLDALFHGPTRLPWRRPSVVFAASGEFTGRPAPLKSPGTPVTIFAPHAHPRSTAAPAYATMLLVGALTAAGFGLTVLALYPGYMTNDAT